MLILGEEETAIQALLKVLDYPEDKAICHGLNIVAIHNLDDQRIIDAIISLSSQKQYGYSQRLAVWLTESSP